MNRNILFEMQKKKMIRKFLILFLTFGISSISRLYAQAPVDVAESTLKVGAFGEEFFVFGFAEGDQLVFNFEEATGKDLKELEIIELPSSSKYMEYKTKKIENKTIRIAKTGIYKFRFANGGLGIRLCKYKIQRIPASPATQHFDPTVYWHTVSDTTYTTIQETFLSNTDTVITNFQDRVVKVNAISGSATNKTVSNFVLPENTIAWSYYITADPSGLQVYDDASKKLTPVSGSVIAKSPMYGPLAALSINTPSYLTKLPSGEDINYWIVEGDNSNLFLNGAQFRYIKKGKAINDFSRMDYRKGSLFFCFSNDNATEPVTVTVKITAIHVNEILDTRPGKSMQIVPKTEMYLKNCVCHKDKGYKENLLARTQTTNLTKNK